MSVRFFAAMSLLLPAMAAQAACLSSPTSTELDGRLAAGERAYADLDAEGFDRALDDVRLMLPCLSDIASPAISARVHRLLAIRLYAQGDEEGASASLTAARVLEPGYAFPDEILPADHALRLAYEAMPIEEGRTERPPPPRNGGLVFDGNISPTRPLDRATLLQIQTEAGVSQTRLISPGDALPPYLAVPRARQRLLVGSAALLASSAGLYAWAWTTHDPFWSRDADPDLAELEQLQAKSRTLTALSGACFGVSTVGVVLAFGVADGGRP